MTGTYQIANKIVQITTAYKYFHKACEAYRVYKKPNFQIATNKAEIDAARIRFREQNSVEEHKMWELPGPYMETLLIQEKLAEKMPRYNSMFVKGSSIVVDGKGFLFIARNGISASDYGNLWSQDFGSRSEVISANQSLLHVMNKRIMAYGIPWERQNEIVGRVESCIDSICIISFSKSNGIELLNSREASDLLLQKCHQSSVRSIYEKTRSLIGMTVQCVSIYSLYVNMTRESVEAVYDAIQGSG